MKGRFRITVDRDSVAMGDDMRSHKRKITARPGARLSSLLATAAPEIHAAGWSWVAFADGEVVCVWSIDHGVQLLVRDRRTAPWNRPHEIRFRYFRQLDPAWLHACLAEGALAIPNDLERAFAPIAAARQEQEHQRRARETTRHLIGQECCTALESLGARVLH